MAFDPTRSLEEQFMEQAKEIEPLFDIKAIPHLVTLAEHGGTVWKRDEPCPLRSGLDVDVMFQGTTGEPSARIYCRPTQERESLTKDELKVLEEQLGRKATKQDEQAHAVTLKKSFLHFSRYTLYPGKQVAVEALSPAVYVALVADELAALHKETAGAPRDACDLLRDALTCLEARDRDEWTDDEEDLAQSLREALGEEEEEEDDDTPDPPAKAPEPPAPPAPAPPPPPPATPPAAPAAAAAKETATP